MDSNLPANYWRAKLTWAKFRRHKLVKKAAWSAEDADEMDEINEMIEYYENMLEWCDIRDNDNWSWDQWLSHLANKKKPQVNKIIGTLPVEEF